MTNLIGVHECKMDEKGRLMLPSPLKKQLMPVLDDGFVIKKSIFHKCLELFPKSDWEVESGEIITLSRFRQKHGDFIRMFMDGAINIELDAAGRFLIPKILVLFAGLRREVVLASAVNRIEIWDKDQYERVIEEGAATFAELAEEVMGNRNRPNSATDNVP